MPQRFEQALTIGATGMLSATLDYVQSQSAKTTVVSRNAAQDFPGDADAHSLDYSNPDAFFAALEAHLDLTNVDLALLWIRDNGNKTTMQLLNRLAHQECLIIHVAGSAAGDPERQLAKVTARVDFGPNCTYLPVILGNMPDGDRTRWMTHEEISAGAIKAIRTRSLQMVGNPVR